MQPGTKVVLKDKCPMLNKELWGRKAKTSYFNSILPYVWVELEGKPFKNRNRILVHMISLIKFDPTKRKICP